jgi:hypothetical protein
VSVHTGTNPATLKQITDDIHQLTHPIHAAVRGRVITHAPLLDQLRDAATPSGSTAARGPERRNLPGPRAPARVDALDALAETYVAISGWHARLELPSPPVHSDWQKRVLRQIAGTAPTLAPSVAEWLAIDVHNWWTDAARAAGWRPTDLLKLR